MKLADLIGAVGGPPALVVVAKSCDATNGQPASGASVAVAPARTVRPIGRRATAGPWAAAILVAAASCAAGPGTGTVEAQRTPKGAAKSVIELPADFGVYYESPTGLRRLMANVVVDSKSPSFIVYLKEMPAAEKIVLRFGNSGNMSLYSVKSGELAGVFDARMSPVEGRPEVYRAELRTELKPGKYVAYTFTDVSKSAEPWSEARFEYAGSIEVE